MVELIAFIITLLFIVLVGTYVYHKISDKPIPIFTSEEEILKELEKNDQKLVGEKHLLAKLLH